MLTRNSKNKSEGNEAENKVEIGSASALNVLKILNYYHWLLNALDKGATTPPFMKSRTNTHCYCYLKRVNVIQSQLHVFERVEKGRKRLEN